MGKWVTIGCLAVVIIVASMMAGCPVYNVWQKGLSGKAALKQAEWDRQITEANLPILEATRKSQGRPNVVKK